jgi:Tfp pilus assembly protein PilO
MMGDTPLTVEYVFGGLVSFVVALLWYWIKGIKDEQQTARAERAELKDKLYAVMLGYATKQEAAANQQNVMAALGRLEDKMDNLSNKMDRKADK